MPKYCITCLLAAFDLGGVNYVNNMLDYTYLSNGETKLRNYLQNRISIPISIPNSSNHEAHEDSADNNKEGNEDYENEDYKKNIYDSRIYEELSNTGTGTDTDTNIVSNDIQQLSKLNRNNENQHISLCNIIHNVLL